MNRLLKYNLDPRDIDRIVEMAWEDRTPFDAIEAQFGVPEKDVIRLMKWQMHPRNWKNGVRGFKVERPNTELPDQEMLIDLNVRLKGLFL